MTYSLFYSLVTDTAYTVAELESQLFIKYNVNMTNEFFNRGLIYPVNETPDPYDPRLYTTVATYTINGTEADQSWTPTAIPLADAKVLGVDSLKERSKTRLETKSESFPLLALIASASRLQADRDADAEAILSNLRGIMAQLQTDIDSVNAATSVTTIDVILNSEVVYDVTVSGGVFYLDGVQQPSLTLEEGKTYSFDQSDSSNSGHPLKIYDDANKTTEITVGVEIIGTPGSADSYTRFTPSTTGTFSYQCEVHAAMGGDITVS
mgnify:CR=1 FL=1